MAKLKYIIYKNYIQKENKTSLNLDNVSSVTAEYFLSFLLLSINMKIQIK